MVKHQNNILDHVFHALADPTRREMLQRLADHPYTVTELAEPFDMSLAAASKHIKVLEEAGLVSRTIQGRLHICRLEPKFLAAANQWLNDYDRFWTNRLDALEHQLRTEKMNESKGGPKDE
ncbi:ArsR/SmtB family transcription factor [Camelliibacillus cellulosilyticus]|uniref:ArsR/SmtB family transcription factor n=1 Tax=Camelliibacillus cellulosilyticus TaxID=2174486 RepID=A0ABV9GQG3_9BACL